MIFLTYPLTNLPSLNQACILTLDAPLLSYEDREKQLFLIDGTWRYAKLMAKTVPASGTHICRSLPPALRTAYPRRQSDCPDPERGLASIEALYMAYTILNRPTDGLLDNYHWKEEFLVHVQKVALS